MALQGIRLSDLYSSKDYNNWISNEINKELVDQTIERYPNENKDMIRGHLYMNSKIKSQFGEETFNSLSPRMRLEDKIAWFNKNAPAELQNSLESELEEELPTSPKDSLYNGTGDEPTNISGFQNTRPSVDEGDIVPTSDNGHAMWDWFKERSDGAADRMYQQYLNANKKKPADSTVNPLAHLDKDIQSLPEYQQLERMKQEHPENTVGIKLLENAVNAAIERQEEEEEEASQRADDNLNDFRLIFDNFNNPKYTHVDEGLWGSAKTNDTIDELTTELRNKMEASPQFAFSAFEQFDRLSDEMIPKYRNYHDTDAMPITPNEMKDLMAQYYAIRTIKNVNEANGFVQNYLERVLYDHQSILDRGGASTEQYFNNIMVPIVGASGIVRGTMETLYNYATGKNEDIDDIGFIKELLFRTQNNWLTQWANNLASTGVWAPSLQEAYKEAEYNALELHKRPNENPSGSGFVDFLHSLDLSTPFEIYSQGGFTVGGMVVGTAAAQLLNGVVAAPTAALATRWLTSEGAGWATRVAARVINALGSAIAAGGAAYLPAASEASMDATEKYNTIKQGAENDALNGLERELQQDLQDGTFEAWYTANSRLSSEMPEELRNQEREYLLDEYRKLKAQRVLEDPDIQKAIEHAAFRAGAKTMFDEATWIAFGDMFFSNILGRSFKELKRGAKRAITGRAYTPYNWVVEGNHYKAVPKPMTGWQKAGAVARGFVEAGEEGVEEGFQTVDSQMREDLAHNYIAEYIANRYDPEAIAQLSDHLKENWDVAKASIGENMFSEEAFYSFFLGAVSAGIGSPTVVQGLKTRATKKAKGEKATFWDFWRNPIVENLQDLKVKHIQSEEEANDINRWLQAHPEIATYNDETAILKFIADKNQAIDRDDEALYRDALMGQKVATLLMMDRVRPNGMKLNLHARLKALSELNASSPEARAIVDQVLGNDDSIVRTTEGPLNEEELKVLEQAKKRAKEDINTYRNVKAQMTVLDSQFGNAISQESKEALAYGMVMHTDWGNRVSEIIKSAQESYTKANPENQVSPIGQEDFAAKNAIAKYGSLKGIEDEYKALIARRDRLRANKKRMYKYEYKTEFAKTTKQIQENRAAKRALEGKEDTVVTASEILSLSNKAMAYLLDSSNKKNYSEAQQKEIEKFVSSDGINDQVLTDLKDAGRLQNNMDYFKDEYNRLLASNGALIPLFTREVRAKASEKWSRARLGEVLEASSYGQFRDALDKALSTGDFTSEDKAQFQRIFNDPTNPNKDSGKFYDQYKKEEANRAVTRRIIENSPSYKALSDDQKKIASEVISEQQLGNGPLTAQSILDKLNDPKFVEKLTREELAQLAAAINGIIMEKENYDRRAKALAEAQRKAAESKPSAPESSTPNPKQQKETSIPTEKYQKDKARLDDIFRRISEIFTNKTKQQLSKSDFLTFISLFADKDITDNLYGEEFSTELTAENLSKISRALSAAIENASYLTPAAVNEEKYQNTVELLKTISSLLNTVDLSKRVGRPIDLNEFFRNSIVEIAPEFKPLLGTRRVERKLKIKEFRTKVFESLGSEAEKKWYIDSHIEENWARLSAKMRGRDVSCIFIKDATLINAVKDELKVEGFDTDNLPVIVAARVAPGTEGAIKLEDGTSVLYVGLLQDSRPAAVYDENNFNTLRSLALDQEANGVIKQDGRPLIARGIRFIYRAPTSETPSENDRKSIRDWLLEKHNGDKNAAAEDFANNFIQKKLDIENGRAVGTIEKNGKKIDLNFPTSVTAPTWVYSYYFDERPDGTVNLIPLEVRDIDDIIFDEKVAGFTNILDALENSPNLVAIKDDKIQSELGIIRAPVKYIHDRIRDRAKTLQGKYYAEDLAKLTAEVQQYLNRNFNLKKKRNEELPELELSFDFEGDNLVFKCAATDTTDSYDGIPTTLASIPKSELGNTNSVAKFVQEGLRNLIFDEDGDIRISSESNYPIIKIEADYNKLEKNKSDIERKSFEKGKSKSLLLSDVFKFGSKVTFNPTPVGLEINPTAQRPSALPEVANSSDPIKEAIRRITDPKFIDTHEGEHFEVGPNEMEVTTFIKGDTVDSPTNNTIAGEFAKNLGTSVDKLYRVWRKTKSVEGVREYMNSYMHRGELRKINAWVGINKFDIDIMCKEFEKIESFFAHKEEVPIEQDLIFRSTIIYDNKKKTFVGKPDIITVDKNGMYHIYDMKTFRYNPGVTTFVPYGFRNKSGFIIEGMKDFEKNALYWQKQMSMYKAMIESLLGPGTVSDEIGIIPVRLGYSPEGTIHEGEVPGIGARKMSHPNGKPFHLDFKTAPDKSPATRCYDDAIKLSAINNVTDINPSGWKELSKADAANKTLEDIRKEAQGKPIEGRPVEAAILPETSSKRPQGPSSQEEFEKVMAGEDVTVDQETLVQSECSSFDF